MAKGMKVSPQRAKEIEKEKDELRKELQNIDVIEQANDTTKTETDYVREFKKMYVGVRKGLVTLAKQRTLNINSAEESVVKAKELLNHYA